jgi:hypothetical protein
MNTINIVAYPTPNSESNLTFLVPDSIATSGLVTRFNLCLSECGYYFDSLRLSDRYMFRVKGMNMSDLNSFINTYFNPDVVKLVEVGELT